MLELQSLSTHGGWGDLNLHVRSMRPYWDVRLLATSAGPDGLCYRDRRQQSPLLKGLALVSNGCSAE